MLTTSKNKNETKTCVPKTDQREAIGDSKENADNSEKKDFGERSEHYLGTDPLSQVILSVGINGNEPQKKITCLIDDGLKTNLIQGEFLEKLFESLPEQARIIERLPEPEEMTIMVIEGDRWSRRKRIVTTKVMLNVPQLKTNLTFRIVHGLNTECVLGTQSDEGELTVLSLTADKIKMRSTKEKKVFNVPLKLDEGNQRANFVYWRAPLPLIAKNTIRLKPNAHCMVEVESENVETKGDKEWTGLITSNRFHYSKHPKLFAVGDGFTQSKPTDVQIANPSEEWLTIEKGEHIADFHYRPDFDEAQVTQTKVNSYSKEKYGPIELAPSEKKVVDNTKHPIHSCNLCFTSSSILVLIVILLNNT